MAARCYPAPAKRADTCKLRKRDLQRLFGRRRGQFSMIAAPFAIPEKRIEYVSTACSIAIERGWHGILKLIDAHLS
jgi:hypothetical protein